MNQLLAVKTVAITLFCLIFVVFSDDSNALPPNPFEIMNACGARGWDEEHVYVNGYMCACSDFECIPSGTVIVCSADQVKDPITGQCINTPFCGPNQVYDPIRGKCVLQDDLDKHWPGDEGSPEPDGGVGGGGKGKPGDGKITCADWQKQKGDHCWPPQPDIMCEFESERVWDEDNEEWICVPLSACEVCDKEQKICHVNSERGRQLCMAASKKYAEFKCSPQYGRPGISVTGKKLWTAEGCKEELIADRDGVVRVHITCPEEVTQACVDGYRDGVQGSEEYKGVTGSVGFTYKQVFEIGLEGTLGENMIFDARTGYSEGCLALAGQYVQDVCATEYANCKKNPRCSHQEMIPKGPGFGGGGLDR